MWATWRLLRAMRVFGVVFLSYLWQMSWARLLPARCGNETAWDRVHRRNARRLYGAFIRLRGVYIKLGQVLSIMGTFLPKPYVEELEGLQDEVPAQPYRIITRTFIDAFGKKPEEVFTSFSRTPIAAASLGQVHEARNSAGDRLAVKILYPRVAMIIRIDLKVLGWALQIYKTFVPLQQIDRVHEQLTDMLARETDLANEARCIEVMRKNFADDPDVLLPKVYAEWSTKTVMTMSFMDGVKINKRSALDKLGLKPEDVAVKLTKIFYKQLFIDKFFHADPHPGNFFVQRGPEGQVRIVILDLGSASAISENLAEGMLDILRGLIKRQNDLVIAGIDRMGFVAEGGDRALLEKTTKHYFEKLLNLNISNFGKIDPEVAAKFADPGLKREELRNLMKSIAYPDGWFYVERAVVIMFGLSGQLAPKLNVISVGFPYVMAFLASKSQRPAKEPAKEETAPAVQVAAATLN